jgi:hypothetical protein
MKPQDMLKKQFLAIVDKQLKANDPPATRLALKRLQEEEGFTEAESKALIAQCVAQEMMAIMASNLPFDQERYERMLSALPTPPMPEDEPNPTKPK